jgi:hypothetical protein
MGHIHTHTHTERERERERGREREREREREGGREKGGATATEREVQSAKAARSFSPRTRAATIEEHVEELLRIKLGEALLRVVAVGPRSRHWRAVLPIAVVCSPLVWVRQAGEGL